jgi:hypothetical protein
MGVVGGEVMTVVIIGDGMGVVGEEVTWVAATYDVFGVLGQVSGNILQQKGV